MAVLGVLLYNKVCYALYVIHIVETNLLPQKFSSHIIYPTFNGLFLFFVSGKIRRLELGQQENDSSTNKSLAYRRHFVQILQAESCDRF